MFYFGKLYLNEVLLCVMCYIIIGSIICDVTARYASQWCTNIQKMRVNNEWWKETLSNYSPPLNEVELEDNDIKSSL